MPFSTYKCIVAIRRTVLTNTSHYTRILPFQFAQLLAKFAKTAHTALDELIDFMVVQSALKDNDEAEKAYVKTLGEKAQAKLLRRGWGSSDSGKKWFGMG